MLILVAACGGDDGVSRELGARCTLDDQCDERCLSGGDWPDGFCSISCDSDTVCPTGALCMAEDTGGVCAFSCNTDGDCAFLNGGYTCQERDDQNANHAAKIHVCRG